MADFTRLNRPSANNFGVTVLDCGIFAAVLFSFRQKAKAYNTCRAPQAATATSEALVIVTGQASVGRRP